jgi:hypothetical protein
MKLKLSLKQDFQNLKAVNMLLHKALLKVAVVVFPRVVNIYQKEH